MSTRQTRRTHKTEQLNQGSSALDPWSDDSCRDYLLHSTIEELKKRRHTLRATEEVGIRFATTYTAPSVSSSHPGSTSNARLSASKQLGAAANTPAAARTGLQQSTARALAEKPLGVDARGTNDESEFKTPMRLTDSSLLGNTENAMRPRAIDAAAKSQNEMGAPSPVARALLPLGGGDKEDTPSAKDNVAKESQPTPAPKKAASSDSAVPPPLQPTPMDDIVNHFEAMLAKGVVLERFSVKDLIFVAWILRGKDLAAFPKKREALLMDARTFYYETLKKVRTTPSPPRKPDLLPGEKPEQPKEPAAEHVPVTRSSRRLAAAAAAAAAATAAETSQVEKQDDAKTTQKKGVKEKVVKEAENHAPVTRGVKDPETTRTGGKRKQAVLEKEEIEEVKEAAKEKPAKMTRGAAKKVSIVEEPEEVPAPTTRRGRKGDKTVEAATTAKATTTQLPTKRAKLETAPVTPTTPFRTFTVDDVTPYMERHGKIFNDHPLCGKKGAATVPHNLPAWLPQMPTEIFEVLSGRRKDEGRLSVVIGIVQDETTIAYSNGTIEFTLRAPQVVSNIGGEASFGDRALEAFRVARRLQHGK